MSLEFWHTHLGRYLSDLSPEKSPKASLPTRTKRGVMDRSIGAGNPAYYIVTPDKAWLISEIDLPSTEQVEMIPLVHPEGRINGERYIARWLIETLPTGPLMIGKIGNANPVDSFAISHPPHRMCFCDMSESVLFDLSVVSQAIETLGEYGWNSMKTALRVFADLKSARREGSEGKIERAQNAMMKLLKKQPDLQRTLEQFPVRENSGEWRVMDWVSRRA